jgi:hypothetical protein
MDFPGLDFDGPVGKGHHRPEGLGRVVKGEDRPWFVPGGAGPGAECLLHRLTAPLGLMNCAKWMSAEPRNVAPWRGTNESFHAGCDLKHKRAEVARQGVGYFHSDDIDTFH